MSCKNCERQETLAVKTDADIQAEIEEQLFMEIDLAPDEIKEKRLSICAECPFLAKHTCTKCGCYAGFRASLSFKSCPVGKW